MRILGITGGSGCGKTTALEAARTLGALALDCDVIYHSLLDEDQELLARIEKRFPSVVQNGCLARKALGRLVFSDHDALLALNDITHSAVRGEVLRRLESWPGELAAIDAIALLEGNLAGICTWTVAVCAPYEDRIARLMTREGVSREYAVRRIQAQPDDAYYQTRCDYCLNNRGTKRDFFEMCLTLFRRLTAGVN